MSATYSKLHQNIQDRFNEANVEIMSPHFIGLRDGNTTNIPQSYLAKDYEPQSHSVKIKENSTNLSKKARKK